jgi:hypothetical protein
MKIQLPTRRLLQRGVAMAFGLWLWTGCIQGAQGRELVVVSDGKSPYVIAVAQGADKVRIGRAAAFLRSTIAEATGVTLPVVPESEVRAGTPAVYLGQSQAARRAGIAVDDVTGWSYHNRVVGEDIFLVGRDEPGDGKTTSVGSNGSFKAVTAFLEREAGVRFVLPGPLGLHIPKRDRLVVDVAMNVSWSPLFKYMAGRRVRSDTPEDLAYAVANNFFDRNGVLRQYGGHSYYTAVPAATYGQTNPEYFALINGVRTPEGNHLCISNPEVQELMLKELERAFDQGYEMAELSQTDGYKECRCEPCQAIHPDIGEKIWIVHRKLAEEMNRRRPGRKVVMLSYVWTVPPPKSFDRFPENVVIQTNRYVPEYFQVWAPFKTSMAVYLANWLYFTPRIAPRYAVDQIRLFLANDVQGIYVMGGLDCNSGSPWGLNGPSYYAFGKAMEDPRHDADKLENDYITAAFGEAAAPMHAFFRALHRRQEIFALLDRREQGLPDRRYRGYGFTHEAGDFYCHFFPPQMLHDMSANLEHARTLATDRKVKARLELVDAEFKYLYSVAMVFHLYRAYQSAPGWASFDLLAAQVKEHERTLEWLFPNGKTRAIAGLRVPFNGRHLTGSRLAVEKQVPFTWNFADLRQQARLPGGGPRGGARGGVGTGGLPPYTSDGLNHRAAFTGPQVNEVIIE